MKLRHLDIQSELAWDESHHLCELIIESPTFLRQVLRDLAVSGDGQRLSITSSGAPLDYSKDVEVIFNPFKLNFSNRKAVLTLLKILNKTAVSEDFYLSTNKLKTKIIKYFDEIINSENFEFEVEADDFNIDSLAKAVNIHIVDDEDDFIELLTDYMAMMVELAGTKIFVFVNLRSIITDEELERLHHNLKNHQIDVLLVESAQKSKIADAKRILIDKDLCEL